MARSRPTPAPHHAPHTSKHTRNRVMAVKIEKKITGYAVVGADAKDKAAAATPVAREAAESELPTDEVIHMHERRSEEHTSELQSLMRISYAVFCLKNKNKKPAQS